MFDWVTTMCCMVAVLTVSVTHSHILVSVTAKTRRRPLTRSLCLLERCMLIGNERYHFLVGYLSEGVAGTSDLDLFWHALLLCHAFRPSPILGCPRPRPSFHLVLPFSTVYPPLCSTISEIKKRKENVVFSRAKFSAEKVTGPCHSPHFYFG